MTVPDVDAAVRHLHATHAASQGGARGDAQAQGRAIGRRGLREDGTIEGIAVHRRVVVRGHVDRRDDVVRQHAVERVAQR